MDIHKLAAWAQILSLPTGAYCAYGTYVNLHLGSAAGTAPVIFNQTAFYVSFGAFAACLLLVAVAYLSDKAHSKRSTSNAPLQIHSAFYGTGAVDERDVAEQLRKHPTGGLVISVDNNALGCDPAPNRHKRLRVSYSYLNGGVCEVIRQENQRLILPEDTQFIESTAAEYDKQRKRDLEQEATFIATLKAGIVELEKSNNVLKSENDRLKSTGERDPSGGLKAVLSARDIPVDAPRVVPVRYDILPNHASFHGVFLANDGEQPAHDIQIQSFMIGGPTGWKALFKEVHRLAKGQEDFARVEIRGRNTAMDLDWPLEMWIKENMYRDEGTGVYVTPSPIRFEVRYRDHASNWYRSWCELGRDVVSLKPATYVRFLNQERFTVQGPSATEES